jgi:4a-hydroxytetrahydrobiopterin dehydratase
MSVKIVNMWQETKDGLYRKFEFKDFKKAFQFMTKVAEIAERQQHHPRWTNQWNTVEIWLNTHEASDLITDKDYTLSEAIDKVSVE